MNLSYPAIALLLITLGLSLGLLSRSLGWRGGRVGAYCGITWAFFIAFVAADLWSFRAGNWIIAIVSFLALREYFSLVDLRLQDRLAVLGAYVSIPFMFHFVAINWYGMFIVSIPVYGFLAIPLLISLSGKETEGTVFSIGVIDFGLFLFVYCMGHISYLLSFSVWMAAMLILNVAICDIISCLLPGRTLPGWGRWVLRFTIPVPITILLTALLSPWTEIPLCHSVILGALIPLLVLMGRHTGDYVEADLGVQEDALTPGRGQILDNLKSLLFTAPVVFHYIYYFLK